MLQLDSVLVRTDDLAEAERLTQAGADLVHTTGVVPSHTGGDVVWREALLRVPVAAALRLGLVALGEGLHDAAATPPAPTAPATTPPTVARTSSGVPLIPPRRHRSRRRLRQAIPCETTTTPHRAPLPTGAAGLAPGPPSHQEGHERPG